MKLYAGSSLPQLAKRIKEAANIPLAEIELSQFPNDELRVHLHDRSRTAILLQSFSRPVNSHIFEFALIADALKRIGAQNIISIVPWYGYSKQDRVFSTGEPLSAKVVADIIDTTPSERLITFDLHNPSIIGFLDIPVSNLSARPLFVEWVKDNLDLKNTIVVSPDAGSVKSSTQFAQELNIDIAYANKIRTIDSGEVNYKDIDTDISGKDVVVLDDMIATGSTLLELSEFLSQFNIGSFTVCATHHLYLKGVQEKLDNSKISRVVVTDSIQPLESVGSDKLETISIAPLIAKFLQKLTLT